MWFYIPLLISVKETKHHILDWDADLFDCVLQDELTITNYLFSNFKTQKSNTSCHHSSYLFCSGLMHNGWGVDILHYAFLTANLFLVSSVTSSMPSTTYQILEPNWWNIPKGHPVIFILLCIITIMTTLLWLMFFLHKSEKNMCIIYVQNPFWTCFCLFCLTKYHSLTDAVGGSGFS